MTKPLSQMLEEIEFDPCDYESIRTFDRMKRVAIELAKACEHIYEIDHKKHSDGSIELWGCGLQALTGIDRAKDIIGEGK